MLILSLLETCCLVEVGIAVKEREEYITAAPTWESRALWWAVKQEKQLDAPCLMPWILLVLTRKVLVKKMEL